MGAAGGQAARRRGIELPVPFAVEFYLPMSASTDARMNGLWHEGKPDADNLLKGLIDAVYYRRKGGDSHVHSFVVSKRWSIEGHFIVWPITSWEIQHE